MPVDRPAGLAALAVILFAAGLAFGTVLGVSVAAVAPEAAVIGAALDLDAGWLLDHRDGEIGRDRAFRALVEHRRGEIGL
jgi:hypothetical protein